MGPKSFLFRLGANIKRTDSTKLNNFQKSQHLSQQRLWSEATLFKTIFHLTSFSSCMRLASRIFSRRLSSLSRFRLSLSSCSSCLRRLQKYGSHYQACVKRTEVTTMGYGGGNTVYIRGRLLQILNYIYVD